MPLLSIQEAIKVYKYSFVKNPKFGMDLYRDDLEIEDVLVLEKNVNLQKNIPIKFDFFALLLCLDGESKRYLNQYTYTITKHSLQLIPPNTIYSFENITPTTEIYILLFTESYVKANRDHHYTQWIQELFDFHCDDFSPILLPASMYSRVMNLYQDINSELHEKQEGYHSLVRLMILKLLIFLKREKNTQTTSLKTFATRAEQLTYLYLDLIEKHFLVYKKVSDYAKLLDVSTKHLGETIKETLGKNALSCIHYRVFKESLYLLEYTNLSIAQIASNLTFQTPSEFSRFSKLTRKSLPKNFD